MDSQLEVEVTLDDGYVYKAFVEDVRTHDVKVFFDKNWKPPIWIEFRNVRFPPQDSNDGFKRKDLVEVRQFNEQKKVYYWRKALLSELDLSTGRYSVTFTGCGSSSPEKFKLSDIRHIHSGPPISQSTFGKIETEIPKKLKKVAKNSEIHTEFRKKVKADLCKFIPEKNILRLISRQVEFTQKMVNLLKDLHLEHLESEMEQLSQLNNSNFCDEFEIAENLMGLALGKGYANVKEARQIKDVTRVELIGDTTRLRVCGKTIEAVKAARGMLEYLEYQMSIPRYLAEEILENDGKIVEEVIQQSGLIRIESGEDEDEIDESSEYPITLVGNSICVENAKALLDYQLKLAERKWRKKQAIDSKPTLRVPDLSEVVERITFKKDLKGLAIGKNYENVKKAEEIPGVIKIDEEMPMFIVYAKHITAAKEARKLLEYDEETVEVQQRFLGRIIGKSGITIKRIEELSKGVRIRIPHIKADSTSNSQVSINVAGPVHLIQSTIDLIRRAESFGKI